MIEIGKEKQFMQLGELPLESGQTLSSCQLCYQVVGQPNSARDNIVLIPGYYGGTHWGSLPLIGAGSPLLGGDYCVVLTNLLGAGWSSSPSNTPAPQQGAGFPRIGLADNVEAQHRLLDRLFGEWRLALVCGWSMGGMQAFAWAMRYPQKVARILPFCATARCWPHNRVFLEGVRAALCVDAAWQYGHYRQPPQRGLRAFARVYAGWAYSQAFYREALYRELGFASIEELLLFWEQDHLQQDANDLLCVLDTWQGSAPSERDLRGIRARALIMPCSSDLYFTVADARHEASLIAGAELRVLQSDWGHCAGGPGREPQAMRQVFEAMAQLLAQPER
ncbi:alpha/beta fold hydrolase [Stutzerimonas kirkiae]|uniref:Homoserine acetyltransferase n=1 Tax=Stutzerimonas kirkiae TaxID=2211392 RepID=A0A4Q9RD15_9GAMM|nr:alpha/beta fold hydrolase [Stutzerimonas kirkiae]TBU98309.1 homoserine acetyltransferase [Stutzerimonas kirkiae]TBV02023.1 homoserine acetyltransferase [Stutzerimonas kirkiae]TBV06967.1 homoserine acetyltransferase [Stutzerimonas kirkiae]TBV16298.1 homoserine acetyltransferase [Stutzerimonas kirkiae]